MPSPEFTCPACGEEIHPNALACPHCGASEKAGWSDESAPDGLDLPDDEFDYDEFVQHEFGGSGLRPKHLSLFWWVVGIILILAFALLMLNGLW